MKYPLSHIAIAVLLLQACTMGGQEMVEQDTIKTDPAKTGPAKTPVVSSTGSQAVSPVVQQLLRTEAERKPVASRINPQSMKARAKQPLSKRAMPMHETADAYGGQYASRIAPGLANIRYTNEPLNRENYAKYENNPVQRVAEKPVSTFSIDVDTGAYSNVRRFLNQGHLPQKHAVRVEEMINYFNYAYARPKSKQQPFKLVTEIAPTPWNKNSHLLHIGLQGYDISRDDLPAANLVFLVDVSGSMQSEDKLALLKSGLKMLVKQMDGKDRISLVVYAGASGVVLEPTPGDQRAKINRALDDLTAGGSTNGAAGIRLAYQMAKQGFIKAGINRILLATDGDFNVGTTNFEPLKQLVEKQREDGVALTTLGFGSGNYNDHLMEQLADAGNGNYSYIDNLNEARKVLVEQMGATLNTIAKDVKIQIEFNADVVAEYRLIGYENRQLKREDFNNDKIDAGEIGAGHSVTALYEISLKNASAQRIEPLRYGKQQQVEGQADELAFIRLRYKAPQDEKSRLIEKLLKQADIKVSANQASKSYRFAAAVAAFGQQLRGAEYLEEFSYDDILELARDARGKDHFGYRGEFLQLVALAKNLD